MLHVNTRKLEKCKVEKLLVQYCECEKEDKCWIKAEAELCQAPAKLGFLVLHARLAVTWLDYFHFASH